MPSVEANGMTIEYDIRGNGEPMLLIMGLAGQLVDWPDDFVDLFVDEGFQVIRFDNRDIGLSTKTNWTPPSDAKTIRSMITRRPLPGVGYTVSDMAADAAGLLDALGIDDAHVVGMSMGGMIAQELAINHPQKVRFALLGHVEHRRPQKRRHCRFPAGQNGPSQTANKSHRGRRFCRAVHPHCRAALRPGRAPQTAGVEHRTQLRSRWCGSSDRSHCR